MKYMQIIPTFYSFKSYKNQTKQVGIYYFSGNIRFEIISGTQNTSNHCKSHESTFLDSEPQICKTKVFNNQGLKLLVKRAFKICSFTKKINEK